MRRDQRKEERGTAGEAFGRNLRSTEEQASSRGNMTRRGKSRRETHRMSATMPHRQQQQQQCS
eukprot:64349-Rhodomonas_salina.1